MVGGHKPMNIAFEGSPFDRYIYSLKKIHTIHIRRIKISLTEKFFMSYIFKFLKSVLSHSWYIISRGLKGESLTESLV